MSANSATIRSTGGGGFDFEDQVGASLLLKALAGEPFPDMETGRLARLQSQTTWAIDDWLLTFEADEDERRLAISCKSNVQVTHTSIPKDFVQAAWREWSGTRLRKDYDGIALVTRGRNNNFQSAWSGIKSAAAGSDATFAIERIARSGPQFKLLNSVRRGLAGDDVTCTDAELLTFIRHLHVIPTDFQDVGSGSEADCIAKCRRILLSDSLEDARALWEALVKAARDTRLSSGTLDLPALWADLRTRFPLRDHPDFSAAWSQFRKLSGEYVAQVDVALASGHALSRGSERTQLAEALSASAVTILHGESGTGKSALAKGTLEEVFGSAAQVWIGPDNVAQILSAGFAAGTLVAALKATAATQNFLVIDAAERLPERITAQLCESTKQLLSDSAQTLSAWRVLIIVQTEAFAQGLTLARLGITPKIVETEKPSKTAVARTLRGRTDLGWLALHDEALSALQNLRALSWVMDSAPNLYAEAHGPFLNPAAVADCLWAYWTGGNMVLQGLMMRLAVREAAFEHSFAQSEMEPNDLAALQNAPAQLPLKRNSANRFVFQHDLASEWSRFQRLKEIQTEWNQWAAYGENPLWYGALRMLGQHLLRQTRSDGKTDWDHAFAQLEGASDARAYAADILLDALCLDPAADTYLSERAEMLFDDHGRRLQRLLRRFLHIATVPALPRGLDEVAHGISLYFESGFRLPVVGRWPRVVRFLVDHSPRVTGLCLPAVAQLCEQWLTSTPVSVADGRAFPWRRELNALALATARELQVAEATRIYWKTRDAGQKVYAAVFAGTEDAPDEVAGWALEMAQRRDWNDEVRTRIRAAQEEEARAHRAKLESDPEYRQRYEERRSAPTFIPTRRKLPPWPIGPKRSVENAFRETCIHSAALKPMMRIRPEIAAELILATLIDGNPEEDYGRTPHAYNGYGLEHDASSYPTSFWNGPFYSFLQLNPDRALKTLIALVNFCTERWLHEFQAHAENRTPQFVLYFDRTEKSYIGNDMVLNWGHSSESGSGAVCCALAALEKWLYVLIDQGRHVTPYIIDILESSQSAAFLGVLVNVGKYQPSLFAGPLLPLLTSHDLHYLDKHIRDIGPLGFDQFNWFRRGEASFNAARDWWAMPHRQRDLTEIACEVILDQERVSCTVAERMTSWKDYSEPRDQISLKVLKARLSRDNLKRDESGAIQFVYPPQLMAEIEAYKESILPGVQALTLPDQCRKALQSGSVLTVESCEILWPFVKDINRLGSDADLADQRIVAQVAAASTLLVCGHDWIAERPEAAASCRRIVAQAVSRSVTDEDEQRGYRSDSQELWFAAHVIVSDMVFDPLAPRDASPMLLVTSNYTAALSQLTRVAFMNRVALGARWTGLQYASCLWAALSMLHPRGVEEAADLPRWRRWRRWLRTYDISKVGSRRIVDFVVLARRVERLERRRWVRQYAAKERRFGRDPSKRHSYGLSTGVLHAGFAWLLDDAPLAFAPGEATEVAESCNLLKNLLAFEIWHHADDDDDKSRDPLPSQFGYAVLAAIANAIPRVGSELGASLWRCVLSLECGKYHYFIGHFIQTLMVRIARSTPSDLFASLWRAMLEFSLSSAEWLEDRRWYRREELLRSLLGYGSEASLDSVPAYADAVGRMADLYERWAKQTLVHDDYNIAALCYFLGRTSGKQLRMKAIGWIAAALRDPHHSTHRRHDAADNITEFVDVLLREELPELHASADYRNDVLAIVAYLVAQQGTAALALQERARAAFRG